MLFFVSVPSSLGPLFQNEGRCSAFDMEIIFHSQANKTHFHKKGCATHPKQLTTDNWVPDFTYKKEESEKLSLPFSNVSGVDITS